jgi:predicted HD phosphohydrolase
MGYRGIARNTVGQYPDYQISGATIRMHLKHVSFTRMEDGTKEDYEFLEELESNAAKGLADRILKELQGTKDILGGYMIDRFEHSLQSATRAYRDDRSEEYVVMALLHDLGDGLAPYNHGELAASVLRPYVSEETYWIVKHHGIFQAYYYAHHLGNDRNARDRYKAEPFYNATVEFCAKYDQNCFEPEYENLPLEFFEPMVRKIFNRPAFTYDRS